MFRTMERGTISSLFTCMLNLSWAFDQHLPQPTYCRCIETNLLLHWQATQGANAWHFLVRNMALQCHTACMNMGDAQHISRHACICQCFIGHTCSCCISNSHCVPCTLCKGACSWIECNSMLSKASKGANDFGAIGATTKSAHPYCAHVTVGELLAKCAMCTSSDNRVLYMHVQLGRVSNIHKIGQCFQGRTYIWMQRAASATLTTFLDKFNSMCACHPWQQQN